jgi:hypothetical protein
VRVRLTSLQTQPPSPPPWVPTTPGERHLGMQLAPPALRLLASRLHVSRGGEGKQGRGRQAGPGVLWWMQHCEGDRLQAGGFQAAGRLFDGRQQVSYHNASSRAHGTGRLAPM